MTSRILVVVGGDVLAASANALDRVLSVACEVFFVTENHIVDVAFH